MTAAGAEIVVAEVVRPPFEADKTISYEYNLAIPGLLDAYLAVFDCPPPGAAVPDRYREELDTLQQVTTVG